jgi:ABC-type Fe3+-siderophore transport system permease subunit
MSLFTDPNKIPLNYGLKIAAGLTAYFILMVTIGQGHHVELRLLNLFILAAGIFFGLKKFKETHEDHLNYFRALITGVAIGAVGSAIFGFLMFVYLKIDTGFMEVMMKEEQMGLHLNPYMASFIVVLEGVFSGLLVTFVLINWVTTDDVNDPVGESK